MVDHFKERCRARDGDDACSAANDQIRLLGESRKHPKSQISQNRQMKMMI